MIQKTASVIMLALLMISILSISFNVKPVEASGTIYIRADGSIDPPWANITTTDNVTYTFADDIYDSIVVERDNITIDGNGHLLQGIGNGTGIDLSGRGNVTVRDIEVREFYYGVYLYNSSNNTVQSNNVTNNYFGVMLFDSSNNNTVKENVFVNDGLRVIYSYGNIVEDNLVNGKPLTYLEGTSDTTVNWNSGQVILVDCDRVTVENLALSYTSTGIQLGNTSSTIIENTTVTNNRSGIEVWSSSNNSIHGNNVTGNAIGGIGLDSLSNNNTISENIVSNNPIGMEFWGSGNNTVTGNNVTGSIYTGIEMEQSLNTLVSRNNVTNNAYGIALSSSLNNVFRENNIANNDNGLLIYNSSNNKIDHNTFRYNINQTRTQYSSSLWDDGYPSGGNYWSDYTGVDVKSGCDQDQPGSDGIGDISYVIDANNRDRYPLMKPYDVQHDIGIAALKTSKTMVGQGYCMNISVEIINYGIQSENFNITILANSTSIHSQTLTLASRNSTTVTFIWNTTDFLKGNYTISANITQVSGETDTTDNMLIDGVVWVGVPCDIYWLDGYCNMRDIGYICSKFGTTPSSPNWDPNADVTGPTQRLPDGTVNMRDIGEACSNFGET